MSTENSAIQNGYGMDSANLNIKDAALAYLNSYFEDYDWEEYGRILPIQIREISEYVEGVKKAHANEFTTWILEYESISIPFYKKIGVIDNIDSEILGYLKSDNFDLASDAFGWRKQLTKYILDKKDSILAILEKDIRHVEKYAAATSEIDSLKKDLTELIRRLSVLDGEYATLYEVPAVVSYIEQNSKFIEAELAKKGINASDVYKTAVAFEKASPLKAIGLFTTIKGYKDTNFRLQKINHYIKLGEFIEVAEVQFYAKSDLPSYLIIDPKEDKKNKKKRFESKKKKAEREAAEKQQKQDDEIASVSLYPIKNGEISDEPVVVGMSALLHVYGSAIYYIKKFRSVCVYDVRSGEDRELISGQYGDFKFGDRLSEVIRCNDGARIFIKKKIPSPEVAKGCFSSISDFFIKKFKKVPIIEQNDNNFDLWSINCTDETAEVCEYEFIDIVLVLKNKIFYTVWKNDGDGESHIELMMRDTVTDQVTRLLDEHAEIHCVHNNILVYSRWDPNYLNKHLHALNLESREDSILERNIFDFYKLVGGRVYYTVGNEVMKPLFSIALDGTDRKQILKEFLGNVTIDGKWIYSIEYENEMRLLVKQMLDGTRKTIVCRGVKRIFEVINGKLFYLNEAGAFCIVNCDGTDLREIAYGVANENDIKIDRDYIYFKRFEYVGAIAKGMDGWGNPKFEPVKAYSLYRVDHDGNNLVKVAFNVDGFSDGEDGTLYLKKTEIRAYEVAVPISKKHSEIYYENYKVTRFMRYEKESGDISEIVAYGLPEERDVKIKGCFLFGKKMMPVQYTEMQMRIDFTAEGNTAAGEVDAERRMNLDEE